MADYVVGAARDNAYETEGLPIDAAGYRDSSKEFRQVVKAGVEMICDALQSERECWNYADILRVGTPGKPLSARTAAAVKLAALKMV